MRRYLVSGSMVVVVGVWGGAGSGTWRNSAGERQLVAVVRCHLHHHRQCAAFQFARAVHRFDCIQCTLLCAVRDEGTSYSFRRKRGQKGRGGEGREQTINTSCLVSGLRENSKKDKSVLASEQNILQ